MFILIHYSIHMLFKTCLFTRTTPIEYFSRPQCQWFVRDAFLTTPWPTCRNFMRTQCWGTSTGRWQHRTFALATRLDRRRPFDSVATTRTLPCCLTAKSWAMLCDFTRTATIYVCLFLLLFFILFDYFFYLFFFFCQKRCPTNRCYISFLWNWWKS